uniref:Reverse transcriptase domain-containing protein n=1 Tax=Tanacetum cinerariifolium TaxID=118510 RepID=A0A6L2M4Q6_TANCI|nr:hypothetical protein [Tanacetum cinerariifolium]
MNYFESNPCYDSNYFGFDQIEPPQYPISPSLNIQNEPDNHELFIKTEDSLRIGDEHLDTIPATKSDEFIKSSVENLIPSPSESEDLSHMTTSHFLMKTFRIKSIQILFLMKKSFIDSLFDEFVGELILLKTIPPGIDETDCDPEEEIHLIKKLLYDNSSPRPPEEFISENFDAAIESFSPSPIPVEDINLSLNIQNEPDAHELFISKLIQQKLQNEYAQPFSDIAITLELLIVEPEDSLRMGDEHLDTILETELDEFIKSSVENLVPSPSESEDLSDGECDVPACDDFTTFSNLLFDADDDFSSSDDESFSDEYISKKIYSNPLFHEEIISMKIEPHHFNVEIDETDCDHEEEIRLTEKLLYDNSSPRPLEEFISENFDASIESFFPSPIPIEDSDSLIEKIDLSFTSDDPMPSGIEEDDYDSERDMLIFEELLSNDSLSLPENESFHFDIPSFPHPPAKPPDDNSRILTVKMVGDISEHNVPMPRLLPIQPTLVSNQEKSPHILSHRCFKAFQLKYGDQVKLSDPKQVLRGWHPMLILSLVMDKMCVVVWKPDFLSCVFCGFVCLDIPRFGRVMLKNFVLRSSFPHLH